MIDPKCFSAEWIADKAAEFRCNDKNLIEKVIRAIALLDMLASSGCPFHFKGGSSLMLLLKDSRHRLSIDIDIICPPGSNIEDYLSKFASCGFLDYKLIERRQSFANVPKSHSKFYYQLAFRDDLRERGYIMLDVLYEDCYYFQTNKVPIVGNLFDIIGDPVYVNIPSTADVLGDKLTAFAPTTTGIPYIKRGELATLEIIKQLFDIGLLFDVVDNISVTSKAFRKIAAIELGYRDMPNDLSPVFEDIRETSLNISTRGFIDKEKFALLQKGIKSIRPFLYQGQYYIENAIADAAKAAYLVTLIEKGVTDVEHYNKDPMNTENLFIGSEITSKLNKLKIGNPEAFFYWAKTSELLKSHDSY